MLRWWDEPKLLLAGCVDEKVIAFDARGRRKWVFTSEMDPAVYEAAKTYWFKSAPGHEGIHGLYTGAFDEGKSRCFVGSACTLEILDETGQAGETHAGLLGAGLEVPARRRPGRRAGTCSLPSGPTAATTWRSSAARPWRITGRGYDGVPAGHSYVGGWTAQNRTALVL